MAKKVIRSDPEDYAGPGPFRDHNALVAWCQHSRNWPKCPVCHTPEDKVGWLCTKCDQLMEAEFAGQDISADFAGYTRWVNRQYIAMRSRKVLDRWLHAV